MSEWKLVPVKPTTKMVKAAEKILRRLHDEYEIEEKVWTAVLNDAPQPDEQPVATVVGKFLDPTKQIFTCIDVELPLLTKLYIQPPASPDVQELVETLKVIANSENTALDLAYCKGVAKAALAKWEGKI